MSAIDRRQPVMPDERARRRARRKGYVEVRDLRVPMDDGVELLGNLYSPVEPDDSLPTVVIRSPYGRRGFMAGGAKSLAKQGFTVFLQSCRGTWGSEGVFVPQIDEQRDGIATLRWVRTQQWFTGRLAMYGESYMGFTQWAIAGHMQRHDPDNAPDALVLIITMPDHGAITWQDGAYSLRNALGWSRMMDRTSRGRSILLATLIPDPKLRRAFDVLPLSAGDSAAAGRPIDWYQDWVRFESLAEEYWTQQSHTASVPHVKVPVLMITGWYDIFVPWQLRAYAELVEAGNRPRLTVGPWGHVTPGLRDASEAETGAFLREIFAGEPWDRSAPVRAYQTGAETWHDLADWPPAGTSSEPWFLHRGGGVSQDAPTGGATRYTYDPDRPTPAVGGPSLERTTLPTDNRRHERRDDVAVFRSAPLADALEVAGEAVARIRFRSSTPSFDVFVRITDVHPSGKSVTVCDGIRRVGSVGTAATDPHADAEGYREVEVHLWPTFHRFAPGHRVGIQVSSGAHPRYARNPGTGEPAFLASTTVVAQQEISHEGPAPSRIDLPVWRR